MVYSTRSMEKADWSEVLEIYYQGIQTNMATFETECPAFEAWDAQHSGQCRMVAEQDGELVAFAALKPASSREVFSGVMELEIYVDASHRRRGVGELLLKAVLENSALQGFWTLESHILMENLAAIGLHEKCGFRKVGTRERLGKDRFGVWRSVVIMEHRIQTDKAGGCDCYMARTGTPEPGSVFALQNQQ